MKFFYMVISHYNNHTTNNTLFKKIESHEKVIPIYMSWVMLILSGCADEDIIERNSPSFPQSVNTRSAGDGVYDILGYGYDITGPYLDTKSSRAIVFDTNKLLEKGLITPYKLEESRFRYSSGKDVIDFTTNMSSSLQMSTPGILKVIGGASLNIAFGGNSHYNSDYSFAYCTQQYIDSRYRISEADINVLKTCLTKQFIERLSTYTPEQIVEEYGTHVLKDIYLGAKFEVYYMAKSTSSSKKESINAGLGASLFSLFKMDGKFQYDESLAITNKEQSLYYFTIGGDPAVGVQGSLNPENSPSIDIGKWMASVKSSTPKFIDVDNNSQSFIPIYELVTDPTKKQTLKAYIDNYIKSKEVCSISLYPSTTGTRQVSGLGHINQGAGVAIGDIDKNGRPDMILMGIDNPKGKNNFWYKVLYDIDENGYYSKESSILSISAEGWENSGGDIALCDLNNNEILDMVLLCTDKPTTAGRAYRWYYVAYDLKPDGHYNSLSSLNTTLEVLKLRINKIIEMNVKRQEIFNQDIKIEPSRITITPLDQQLVEKAIQIVEDNISETEFSVEELASSLNISRSYFYKKMIKITGKKPIEFIRTIRMKRAQQLLTESQMQVSEIAYTLGYNSPKIFSKHFKEEFNISPSEFIRQQAE